VQYIQLLLIVSMCTISPASTPHCDHTAARYFISSSLLLTGLTGSVRHGSLYGGII